MPFRLRHRHVSRLGRCLALPAILFSLSACSSDDLPSTDAPVDTSASAGAEIYTGDVPDPGDLTGSAASFSIVELSGEDPAVSNAMKWFEDSLLSRFDQAQVLEVRKAWRGPSNKWVGCGYQTQDGNNPLLLVVFNLDMSKYRDDVDIALLVTDGETSWETFGLSDDLVWDDPTVRCEAEPDFSTLPVNTPEGCDEVEWPTLAESFDAYGQDAPDMTIDVSARYRAEVSTSCGDFTIELDPSVSPTAVNSFVYLAESDFYDDIPLYRIVTDFVFQAGRVLEDMSGGPDYVIEEEPGDAFPPYSVGLANKSVPFSTGGQFFVVTSETAQESLVGGLIGYSYLGMVVDGTETVDRIAAAAWLYQDPGDFESQLTQFPLVIYSIEITQI